MALLYSALALIIVALAAWLINTRVPVPANTKPILNLVLALLLIGIVLWLINNYVPMAASIKLILNIVVVVATCVRVLQTLGLWNHLVRLWTDLTRHRLSQ